MRIRPATAADVAAIEAIVERAYGVYVYGRLGYSVDERRQLDGFALVFLSKRLGDGHRSPGPV